LHTSTVPAPAINAQQAQKISDAAKEMIRRLDYVGVLCIEFFVLKNGELVANEMAPRPHNSGHYTQDACVCSQFEQQVRAMARLPLGSTAQHTPAMMLNLLGDEWLSGDAQAEPAWAEVLRFPEAKLHLYGKAEPRQGRKMGHINLIAKDSEGLNSLCAQVSAILKINRQE